MLINYVKTSKISSDLLEEQHQQIVNVLLRK